MEVYKLSIFDGWDTVDEALFSIDEQAESKITSWATERIRKYKREWGNSDEFIVDILKDISKFKLTSGEVLITAQDIRMVVTTEKIL